MVGGIAQIGIWLFIKSARMVKDVDNTPIWHDTKDFFKNVSELFSKWRWPTCVHNPPRDCFNDACMKSCTKSDDKLKCGASELIDLYPVFDCMVEVFGLKLILEPQVASLRTMFKVLDRLLAPRTNSQALLQCMRCAMSLYKRAYPENPLVPKWHDDLHIPSRMEARSARRSTKESPSNRYNEDAEQALRRLPWNERTRP